jgi:hypothetical protein
MVFKTHFSMYVFNMDIIFLSTHIKLTNDSWVKQNLAAVIYFSTILLLHANNPIPILSIKFTLMTPNHKLSLQVQISEHTAKRTSLNIQFNIVTNYAIKLFQFTCGLFNDTTPNWDYRLEANSQQRVRVLLWPNLRQYLSLGLKGLRKTTKKPVKIVCVTADLNRAPSKYNSEVLPFEPTYLVTNSILPQCCFLGLESHHCC